LISRLVFSRVPFIAAVAANPAASLCSALLCRGAASRAERLPCKGRVKQEVVMCTHAARADSSAVGNILYPHMDMDIHLPATKRAANEAPPNAHAVLAQRMPTDTTSFHFVSSSVFSRAVKLCSKIPEIISPIFFILRAAAAAAAAAAARAV
jgi:hypothetical protein